MVLGDNGIEPGPTVQLEARHHLRSYLALKLQCCPLSCFIQRPFWSFIYLNPMENLWCVQRHSFNTIGFSLFQLCLVYPYMPNGTLEKRLRAQPGVEVLTSEQRFLISNGVASGLYHLHSRQKPLVHRDVKPSNILLTEHCTPKVSWKPIDCGLHLERERERESARMCWPAGQLIHAIMTRHGWLQKVFTSAD